MPIDIYPKSITPILEKQVNAYQTIADLENVDCSETAQYNSDYTSPMLQYLKNEISIDDFLEKIRDISKVESTETEVEANPTACMKYEQLSLL